MLSLLKSVNEFLSGTVIKVIIMLRVKTLEGDFKLFSDGFNKFTRITTWEFLRVKCRDCNRHKNSKMKRFKGKLLGMYIIIT